MAYNLGYVDSGGYNLGYSGAYNGSTPGLYPYVFTDHGVADDNSFLKSAKFASTQQIDFGVVSDFDSNKLVVDWQAISDGQLWRSDINTLDAVTVVSEVDTTDTATLRYRITETGYEGTFTVTVNITESLEVDTTAPTITSVDVPTASYYKTGDTLTFTSNFSESVDVTGIPAINFTVNGSARQANYSSGTGSNALVFTYTVQSGDDTEGLSVTSLSLDGGTIEDAAANAADLTLVSVGDTSGIIIDTVAPTVGVADITTTNTAPTISGTASGVDQVSVVVNSVTYTPAVTGGTWSQQLPTLAVNDYPVTVDAIDDAGNTAVQATATLSIVEAGDGFPVIKGIPSNSIFGSNELPTGAIVSLIGDDNGNVTMNSLGVIDTTASSSVATIDVDGTVMEVFVRPVGTPVKPFYKINWQIME